ncbi:PRC-barrel domain-containing protein [Acidisoma sp. 7E03]
MPRLSHWSGAAAIALLMPFSAPAFAQSTTPGSPANVAPDTAQSNPQNRTPDSAGTQTGKVSDQALGDKAPQANITRVDGKWRMSKLVGTTVYNEKGLVLGTVNDLLMSENGTVQEAVLSVGGVLGLGSKLVKVPFDKLKLVPSQANPAHAGSGSTVATPPNAPETKSATAASGGTPGASSATPAQNFDYGLIYPGATKQSLRDAPDFTFKPS